MAATPATRLMLITPELAEIEAFEPMLRAALAAGDIAAVVIRLAPADERARLARAKTLVQTVQDAGAAALLAGDGVEDIVGKSGADGLQANAGDGFRELIERFKPEKIVGAVAQGARDDAMEAGEAGADYVLFGDPSREEAFETTLERVSWWVPIFEVPCVGLARSIDDVAALAAADAEFAALGDAVWRHEEGPAAAVASAEAMLSLARQPAP
ncbi:thiamine phosphate synthase [Hansschlegelia sp.]|uniref:thiamine phosphate synthase n=1 Tax=Hansschlegelia sp. TaxID=2041892 RepID=UPI002CED2A1D|nr:thiamine phosphate synthase [Hansschlegelia sp.]HVI27771.1 thiamine phosphate synthase [Hansschlegelia sp.]